jgi:hypothetical protein
VEGLGGEEAKPGFTQSVSVITVRIIGVICYFVDFPDVAGKVGPDGGHDRCCVEVDAGFCLCGSFGYCRSLFSSLVSGMVDM